VAIASAAAKLAATGIDRIVRPSLTIPLLPGRRIPVADLRPASRPAHAAGFAAGVSLELPGLALPMSALVIAAAAAPGTGSVAARAANEAGAAAASRAAPGRMAGVAAGFIVGAAAAITTLRWWPRRPAQPAQAVRPRCQAPMPPTGDGVVLVANRAAAA